MKFVEHIKIRTLKTVFELNKEKTFLFCINRKVKIYKETCAENKYIGIYTVEWNWNEAGTINDSLPVSMIWHMIN